MIVGYMEMSEISQYVRFMVINSRDMAYLRNDAVQG
jgi:hypothetical protein